MGRDKALLPYGDTTFLGDLIASFREIFSPVVVVLGHNAQHIIEAVQPDEQTMIAVNPNYDLGMLSSLQTGLRALPRTSGGAAFTLVDHPGVRIETLRAIADGIAETAAPVVIPRYRGERGHPVAVSGEVIDALLALDPAASPQDVIRSRRDRTVFLDIDDPAVTRDIDRPDEYASFQQPPPHSR